MLDALLTTTGWPVYALERATESGPTIPQYLAAGVFVILSLVSLNRSRPWRRWFGARAGD